MSDLATTFAPLAGAPSGRYHATRVSMTAHQLLVLDDLWTEELRLASDGALSEDDIETFGAMVSEMQTTLDILQRDSRSLGKMLAELEDEIFDEAFARIVESPDAPPALRELAGPMVEESGLRRATIAACEHVEQNADSESLELDRKLAEIRAAGEVPEGDWKRPFRCSLALLLAGGTVAAIIVTGNASPIAVGLLAADRLYTGLKEWVREGCPTALPKIDFGRRAASAER